MKKHFGLISCTIMLLSLVLISWKPKTTNKNFLNTGMSSTELLEKYIENIYQSAHLQQSGLDFTVFKRGVTGFINLKIAKNLPKNTSILTIVDFSKSSNEKRMWIVDLLEKSLILNTWVAHGQGSGEVFATHFSDRTESHASSLGFYITDDVYYGKNGRSLRLDGMDHGFNTNARARSIVIHAADYVGPGTIGQLGYLGRSFGCPAVSPEVADLVINTLKEKTVIFISANDYKYNSRYLDEDIAANFVSQEITGTTFANL